MEGEQVGCNELLGGDGLKTTFFLHFIPSATLLMDLPL